MPSVFSHAVVAVAAGHAMRAPRPPVRFWVLGVLCAVLPDADVLSFYAGVPDVLVHRGLTHSLPFAVASGFAMGQAAFRGEQWDRVRLRYSIYFTIAMASHGLLDAFTAGGRGIAYFAPFSDARWASPWRPITVSPIGLKRFFTWRGREVLTNELLWLWLPSLALAVASAVWRRVMTPGDADALHDH